MATLYAYFGKLSATVLISMIFVCAESYHIGMVHGSIGGTCIADLEIFEVIHRASLPSAEA